MMTLRVPNVASEAGGILKVVLGILVSMNETCRTNRLSIWPRTVLNIIPVIQIGSRRNMVFSSSTWVTVHRVHGFVVPFVWSVGISTAALSKNLKSR